MSHRDIPVFELSDYRHSSLTAQGISVMRLEESLVHHTDRRRPHLHPFFQVFLMLGKGVFMHDFVEHTVEGGVVAFASPGQVHGVLSSVDLVGVVVGFTQTFFDGTQPPPSRLLDFPFFFSALPTPYLRLGQGDPHRFQSFFEEMLLEYDEAKPGAAEILRALLDVILQRASRAHAEQHGDASEARPAQLVRSFRMALEQHFRERTLPVEYAELLGVTVNHLNDTVRDETGQSAGQLIRERRVLDAKRLLLHSELSMSEIAYHLGFLDPSYFSRFFKRDTGQSPNDFRASIREKYQESTRRHQQG